MSARLFILTPPPSLMSGSDRFNARTVAALRRQGIAAERRELGADAAGRLLANLLPYRLRTAVFRACCAHPAARAVARELRAGDVAWILDTALPRDASGAFERRLRARGVHVICHLQDNGFDLPGALHRRMAHAAVSGAELVTTPNAALAERIRREAPGKPVLVIEEPVDTVRLEPPLTPASAAPPLVVWAGNIANLGELEGLSGVLADAHRLRPFRLRVVAGQRPRRLALPVPVELHAYDPSREAALLAGARAGLAPLADTPFARCKGAYKVKVYLAAGVPVVASPVGRQAELVRHGETGFLAAGPEEWATALGTLLTDPARAETLGRAARADACARFDHDAVVPAWAPMLLAHYPSLAGARGAAP